MTGREPAWRVMAQEFEASLEEERGEGERVAAHLLSPLGARMNRVLLVGDLSPADSVGRDDAQPFFRARLTDPTGSVTVTAGGFHPRALAALKAWSTPGPALVVGKAHLFRGRDGTGRPSIRAEAIRGIPEEEYRGFLADAAEATITRAAVARAVRAGSAPDDPATAAARNAVDRYPSLEPGTFLAAIDRVVARIESGPAVAPAPPPAPAPARVTRAPAPTGPAPLSAADRAHEAAFLDILDELAGQAMDGYADLRDALERAEARGLSEAAAEEILNRLEEAGTVEEPVVGKLRRA